MILVFSALAALPAPTDLDGDGKLDTITVEGEDVKIAGHKVEGYPEMGVEIEIHDVSSADKLKEVAVCEFGPRDDRSCRLYRLVGGKPVELSLAGTHPSRITTSGNGIVLGDIEGRIYTRREKYTVGGSTAKRVAQPFYAAGTAVKVDRSFPLTFDVAGGDVVANVAAKTTVTLVLESGTVEGAYLVKTSTGLMGWATLETIASGSDQVTGILGAG